MLALKAYLLGLILTVTSITDPSLAAGASMATSMLYLNAVRGIMILPIHTDRRGRRQCYIHRLQIANPKMNKVTLKSRTLRYIDDTPIVGYR